jgi:hypothetical protein
MLQTHLTIQNFPSEFHILWYYRFRTSFVVCAVAGFNTVHVPFVISNYVCHYDDIVLPAPSVSLQTKTYVDSFYLQKT